MSLSLDQLRSALADHADTADLSAADRLAGVRRAVRTRRRRQATAITSGLAAGAIVALFVGTGVLSLDRGQRPVAPANPTVNGLPLFAHGGRQLGSAQVPLRPGLTHLFTVTPTSYDLTVGESCRGVALDQGITIVINGHDSLGGGCAVDGGSTGASGGGTLAAQTAYWKSLGVRPGRPVSVDLRVDTKGEDTSAGRQAVSLYQAIALVDYPFPTPSGAATLNPGFSAGLTDVHPVTLAGGRANGTFEITLPYDKRLELAGLTTGPGRVEVRVGSTLLAAFSSWDYTASGTGEPLGPDAFRTAGLPVPAAGDPVRLTVEMSGFAARTWSFQLGRGTSSGFVIGAPSSSVTAGP